MTERDAILRAICAAPDDDTPRLVFADWLVDTASPADPEWAEFIRVQINRHHVEAIEHTCRPHPDGGPDIGETECPACGAHWAADDLRNRERELLQAIAGRVAGPVAETLWLDQRMVNLPPEVLCGWDGLVAALPDGPRRGEYIRFIRGLIGEVVCTAQTWARLGPDVAWHPDWSAPCDRCEDKAADWETNVVECRRCDPTGLLAQPCPVEPMPVQFVALTTRPREADYGPEPFTRRTGKPGWEHVRWPGAVFEIPQEAAP